MTKLIFFVFFLFSFVFVAFGQPAWSSFLPYFSSLLGFALFWIVMIQFSQKKYRFLLAFVWFAAVQGIQLSWMTSIEYQGVLILLVYLFLCLALGIEFGFLSLGIPNQEEISITRCLALSGFWVLLEWSRLFFLSGFSWNPVGLALTQDSFSIQFSSLLGIYGLSFLVIFINLLLLKFYQSKKIPHLAVYFCIASIPFIFGYMYRLKFTQKSPSKLSVALVQTGLLPEEKENYSRVVSPIPAIEQWKRIFHYLKKGREKIDLVVLPEVVVPYGTHKMIYSSSLARKTWEDVFSETKSLPKESPFVSSDGAYVSNAFFAQALANYFQADVIAGLYDVNPNNQHLYNAALFFQPGNRKVEQYAKQVLVPIGEYYPFEWCQKIAQSFGIYSTFQPGKGTQIFHGKLPMGVSICYEETYSYIVNDMRKKGAELLVNITNDIWFPESKLPEQHFSHGRVRAVENGVPLVRACNSGVTIGINCFGDIIDRFGSGIHYEREKGALFFHLPKTHIRTIYAKVSDFAVLSSSVFFIGLYFALRNRRKKN